MGEAVNGLRSRIRLPEKGRYLIGLSGGADSVAMLAMLRPENGNTELRIEAVHVNHGLRGTESDGDEAFCADLCRREGIPLRIFRADLKGRTDEAAAREARYAFFRQCYAESGADGLILCHHADDQAETFLMRLLRGAGPDGLEGMREEETVNGIRILRPMLPLRREEIREALRKDGIPWREDSSNRDTGYLRNRIRLGLMTEMRGITETAAEKICRSAALIRKDNDALNAMAGRLLERLARGNVLDAEALEKEEPALQDRVLRLWWNRQGPALEEHALNAAQTETLSALLREAKGKVNLPGDYHAVRDGRFLFLTGGEEAVPEPVTVCGTETVFGNFLLAETPTEGNPGDGKRTQEVPAGFTRGCVIRTRRPGDRIRPFGCNGSRKLQDYLTDRKIPEPFRDRIPLLCREGEVLLAAGVGAGDIPQWNKEDSPVRLTWHGDMPWTER